MTPHRTRSLTTQENEDAPALVVFDFDWSLINENSDTFVIHQLDPSGRLWAKALKCSAAGMPWTELMDWCAGKRHRMRFLIFLL